MRVLVFSLLFGSLWPAGASAQDPLAGAWLGYWAQAGDTLPVTIVVGRDTLGRLEAAFSSDRLRVSGIPFQQVIVDDSGKVTLLLRGDRTTTEFAGRVHGDSLIGVFREGATEGRFAFRRITAARAGYEERDVVFMNGAVRLAGTVLLPRGTARVPAVVFLHGSGAEGRWASRFLASKLAARGFASLIFDKRGVGASTGDWRTALPADLVGDAVAGVASLLKEPRIDPARIGIHGHSQGGTLAPMVAARAPRVSFVIASAAAGLPTDSVELYSVLNSVLPRATTAEDTASTTRYASELVAVAYHGRSRALLDSLVLALNGRAWFFAPPAADNAYWTFSSAFARYDPLDWWRRVRVPVLLLYGAEDQRVPAGLSAARIRAVLYAAGNRKVTTRIFPGADHTFRLRPGRSGWPVTAPAYMDVVLGWLAQQSL